MLPMNADLPADETEDAELADFDDPTPAAPADEAEAPATTAAPQAETAAPGSSDAAAAQLAASAEPQAGASNGEGGGAETNDELDAEALAAVAGMADGPMIPKSRFDEATGKLKDRLDTVQSELESIKAQQQAALAPLPERNFDAERAILKKKFGDGELEDEEYQDQREALILEEAEHKAHARLMLAQAEQQRAASEQAWLGKFNAWAERNAEFMANGIRNDQAVALINRYSQDPNLTDEQVLEKAEKDLFEAFGWQPEGSGAGKPEPTPPPAPANPHAARDARDAAAQSRASVAPDPAAGGAGDRGRRAFPAMLDLKDKDFNALPKEVREAKTLADF